MEGDNVAVNKKRGKDKGKRKSSQWSDERRIAQKKVEDRRAEENKARLNELTPGSVAYLFEMRKQREREKAAEKKRNYRSRRQSIAPSYSPTQQFLTLSDGSVLLNPMRTPLVTGSIAYTYTPISSSSSSTLTLSSLSLLSPSSLSLSSSVQTVSILSNDFPLLSSFLGHHHNPRTLLTLA